MTQRMETILKKINRITTSSPIFFNFVNQGDCCKVQQLIKKKRILHVVDNWEDQQRELFAIKNPSLTLSSNFNKFFLDFFLAQQKIKSAWQLGRWVYYPWLFTLVHVLEDNDFQKVRTARNRNLISEEEQKLFYNARIGIVGLSVGNNVALTLALQGGGRYFKLADFDTLSLSNTNRVRAGIQNLGLLKIEITARQIYEINPYIQIELFPHGINEKNIENFFNSQPKLSILVDEADNIAVKLLLRKYAKKYGLPVVMGADNGDNAVVDIERYDQTHKLHFFHGRLGNVSYKDLLDLDKITTGKTIVRHIGLKNLTARTIESITEIGKSLVSWPQLGGAAVLNGAALAYCVRKIVTGGKLIQNRAVISLDDELMIGKSSVKNRNKFLIKNLKNFFRK